jgi:hypothetical protein
MDASWETDRWKNPRNGISKPAKAREQIESMAIFLLSVNHADDCDGKQKKTLVVRGNQQEGGYDLMFQISDKAVYPGVGHERSKQADLRKRSYLLCSRIFDNG